MSGRGKMALRMPAATTLETCGRFPFGAGLAPLRDHRVALCEHCGCAALRAENSRLLRCNVWNCSEG